MPFSRPSLEDLIERVITDIASRLPGVNQGLLRKSLAGILARAEAGAVHSLYGYLDFIALQAIPDTSTDEYLERWVSIFLTVPRKAATFAAGTNAVAVTGLVGTVFQVGTVFVRSDGQQYTVNAEVTLTGTSGVLSVDAVTAGTAGNTAPGVALTLLQPVLGADSAAVVTGAGIIGGTDQETDASLKARLLRRIQQPPQGGSEADYETWALEVPGVTRAWVYPMQLGPGTVTVLIANDNGGTAPIPDAGIVAAAQAYINERKPVTAIVTVAAPTTLAVPMTIQLKPNTLATRAAVTAELADLFLREAQPGGTILISKLREAVSVATGVDDSRIDVPTANVVASVGAIPVLGTITFGTLA